MKLGVASILMIFVLTFAVPCTTSAQELPAQPEDLRLIANPPEPADRLFRIFGYGMYPGDQVISNIHPGDDWKVNSFIHATWGSSMYQGLQLQLVYPQQAKQDTENITVIQDPNMVKNYFEVSINPSLILLDPDFPTFLPDWTQKISILIHVNDNTPPGIYAIGLNAANPPSSFTADQIYKLGIFKYRDAGLIGIDRPLLLVFVEVT